MNRVIHRFGIGFDVKPMFAMNLLKRPNQFGERKLIISVSACVDAVFDLPSASSMKDEELKKKKHHTVVCHGRRRKLQRERRRGEENERFGGLLIHFEMTSFDF